MKRRRDILNKHSKKIALIIKISRIFPKKFYEKIFKFIRPYDNFFAMFIRFICLKNCTIYCGDNVAIYSNVYIKNLHNLSIGNNVSIQAMCYIEASGFVEIGDDVSIAHASTIMSEEHNYCNINENIKDQGITFHKTVIQDNVWIGAGSRVLAGSYIESGSIVAAGAVVKNKVLKNTIVGGVPARKIKERS